jgi:hypothetical protein
MIFAPRISRLSCPWSKESANSKECDDVQMLRFNTLELLRNVLHIAQLL